MFDSFKKISGGFTNISYKKSNSFFQVKNKNEFNHKIDYKLLNSLDFIPKIINNNKETLETEWIEKKDIENKKKYVEKNISFIINKIFELQNSKIEMHDNQLIQILDFFYNSIKNKKNYKFLKFHKTILKKLHKLNLNEVNAHNDLWENNIIISKEDKIYIIDWEYASKSNKYYDFAYLFEYLEFDDEEYINEIFSLDKSFSIKIFNFWRIVVDYYNLLWILSNEKFWKNFEFFEKRFKKWTKKEGYYENT